MSWYKIECLFDRKAKRVMQMGDAKIVLRGMFYAQAAGEKVGEPELAVCQVPTSFGRSHGAWLQGMLAANLRVSPVVLTNNINLVKLSPISEEEAKAMMGDASGSTIKG